MSDLALLFRTVQSTTPATALSLAGLRVPQRIVWRHVVDGYEYREIEDGEGRVTGARWVTVAGCEREPCFIQTAITEHEARQAGILLDPSGAQAGIAIVQLRLSVPIAAGHVLHVRQGALLGAVYEVITATQVLDRRAKELIVGARRVGEVPRGVRR